MKKKITYDDIQDQKLLIAVTILLAIVSGMYALVEPAYVEQQEAFFATLFFLPLISIWFYAFWNGILVKIVKVAQISYFVALILVSALAVLLG